MEGFSGNEAMQFNKNSIIDLMPFSKNSAWSFAENLDMKKVTMHPTITGSSVLGVTFDKGVMLCADTKASYGTLSRIQDCQRVFKVNDQIIIGFGGDFADFQYAWNIIQQQVIEEHCANDGFQMKPKALHCWLTRLLYNRRSRMDPLWNTFLVGGLEDGVPYLGHVDKIGTAFTAPTIATGFGNYIAQPVLRTEHEKRGSFTEQEAKDLLKHCMTLLYYRDKSAFSMYTIATVTADGVKIEEPGKVKTDWKFGLDIKGYE